MLAVPPCAAPAPRCLSTVAVGAAHAHTAACSRGERGLHAVRAASCRWVLALDRRAPRHVQTSECVKPCDYALGGVERCQLAGTRVPHSSQRRRRTCVAAQRAAVPNTTCAGCTVAASPLIASGLNMLLPGRPCAVGLACAAARALRLADARTLRQVDACSRRWACGCARQLRFPRAQRAAGVARRRRLEALFCWSGAVPLPRAELPRWCGTVNLTAWRRSLACSWLLRRFALAAEHRRRALAAATGARRPFPACCKPHRAAGGVEGSRAATAKPRLARLWGRCTHFCVGSETPRGMRNAGRALLCVHNASSHVSHACPRGDVAA